MDKSLDERGGRLRGEIDQQIAQREQELRGQLSGGSPAAPASAYTAVTLSAGQTLSGEAGCEILLRSGSAACVADSAGVPGMVDATSGGSVNGGGALQANHLYLMPAPAGVRASSEATVLVRGGYSVR